MMGSGHALILHHGPPWDSARTDGPLNLPKHNLSCLPASPQTFQPGQQGQKALLGWGGGAEGGDAAWVTSSVLVLLGSEEQAAKQESGGEAAAGGPEAELEHSREGTHRERQV